MSQETINEAPVMKTEIAEYSQTAAALGALRAKYENVIFPVETTKGMADAKAARRELRDLRVGLEKLRKEIKEPALRRCQLIDSEAKEITGKLVSLEEPIDSQIKVEEDRKEREKQERERVERERVETIRAHIDSIRALPGQSVNDTAEDIEATIVDLDAFDVTPEQFAEFVEEANGAKAKALDDLRALLDAAKAREAAAAMVAAEREELARLRAEAAERERANEQRLRAEADRLAAERAELDRQRAEIDRQRAEMEAAKRAAETPPDQVSSVIDELKPSAALKFFTESGVDIPTTISEKKISEENSIFGATEDQPVPVDEPAAPSFKIGDDDADNLVSELAGYTAMQFVSMAKKVSAIGFGDYAVELNNIGARIAGGEFNDKIKVANWTDMANADKEMALASHACVALVLGDEATIAYSHFPVADSDEVRNHIASGKLPASMELTWQDKLTFQWTAGGVVKRLAFSDALLETERDDDGDPFEADMVIMTGTLNEFLADLTEELGGLVVPEGGAA